MDRLGSQPSAQQTSHLSTDRCVCSKDRHLWFCRLVLCVQYCTFDCKRQNVHACEASPDHPVVPRHFKLALQINHHHCLGNRLRLARKPDNFPIRNYCGALQYPGTFFISLFFCRRITSKRPEVEPCRIGLAQDKAILCCSHLKLESIARRKTGNWKPVAVHQCFTEMPLQRRSRLIIQTLFGSITSY